MEMYKNVYFNETPKMYLQNSLQFALIAIGNRLEAHPNISVRFGHEPVWLLDRHVGVTVRICREDTKSSDKDWESGDDLSVGPVVPRTTPRTESEDWKRRRLPRLGHFRRKPIGVKPAYVKWSNMQKAWIPWNYINQLCYLSTKHHSHPAGRISDFFLEKNKNGAINSLIRYFQNICTWKIR